MRTRHTAPELAKSLGRHGLRFRSFTLASQGQWTVEDADWNYKDVPHLNQVHTQARTVPAAIGDEIIATVNMQKVAGINVPIALANYVASDGSQVYFTTMLCFVLVVETKIVEADGDDNGDRAKVLTTYHVGGPPLAMRAFPLLRRILTANYRVLMSEDIPMREQRGRLRRAGYTFVSDGKPRTFAETVDLTRTNVVAPPVDRGKTLTIELAVLAEGATITAGSGPGGLRITRTTRGEVSIFKRVCDHEGASLDNAPLSGGCLTCPWHAKRIKPLATVRLDAPDRQTLELESGHGIVIENSRMIIAGVA